MLSLPSGVLIRTDPGVTYPEQETNQPATGSPVISGTARVGATLTASTADIEDADGLGGGTFSYQWLASDGTTESDIQGATAASYTLVAGDAGKSIKVR